MAAPLEISWFPHPFFPYPLGKQLCKTTTATKLVEPHNVLTQDGSGFVGWQSDKLVPDPDRDRSADDYEGQVAMGYIETTDPNPLTVLQLHPTCGMVTTVCDFAPAPSMVGGETYGEAIPIWGNTWAFSWEPFLKFELCEQGATKTWTMVRQTVTCFTAYPCDSKVPKIWPPPAGLCVRRGGSGRRWRRLEQAVTMQCWYCSAHACVLCSMGVFRNLPAFSNHR